MPPPPSGGRGVPGPPNLTPNHPPPSASKPISKKPSDGAPQSSSSSLAAASHQPPSLLGNSAPSRSPQKPPASSTSSVQLPTSAESLANIDPEKKIAVLKKAILSLTKQKQDLEMTKATLEGKVTSLATQLAASDEKNAKLEHQNHDLQQQVESFAATARGANRFTTRAGSILKVFSGVEPGATSPVSAASPTSEDQQRLFEENEALHIQLFEQRQQFEKRYKTLEAEKSEQAMQLHALEGVVASFQASDVAQSQQAEEALKELQTERAYNIRCMDIIRSDMVMNNNNDHNSSNSHDVISSSFSIEGDITSNTTTTPSSTLQRIVGIYTDGLGDVLAAVSALMPHIPTNLAIFGVQSQSLEGERKKGLFTKQQKERLQALVVSHRTHRQKIQVEVGKVRDCFVEQEAGGTGASGLPNALTALFSKVKEWLLFIHCNATLILGPLDALRASREKQQLNHFSSSNKSTTMTALLQQIISFFIGEMAVVRDFIQQTSTSSSSSSNNNAIPPSMIVALMCYREGVSSRGNTTGSHNNKPTASAMVFERFVYDITRVLEAAAGGGGGSDVDPTNILSRHYLTCIEQLVQSLGRSRKQLASAVGLGVHVSSISARIAVNANNTSSSPLSSSSPPSGMSSDSCNNARSHDLLRKMLMANGRGNTSGYAADDNDDVARTMGLAAMGSAADVWELVKSSDSNTRHHIANFQHAMTELARMHDLVDSLTQQSGSLLKDKEHMKNEYVSVVQIYESQIAMLSDRLAELTSGGP